MKKLLILSGAMVCMMGFAGLAQAAAGNVCYVQKTCSNMQNEVVCTKYATVPGINNATACSMSDPATQTACDGLTCPAGTEFRGCVPIFGVKPVDDCPTATAMTPPSGGTGSITGTSSYSTYQLPH